MGLFYFSSSLFIMTFSLVVFFFLTVVVGQHTKTSYGASCNGFALIYCQVSLATMPSYVHVSQIPSACNPLYADHNFCLISEEKYLQKKFLGTKSSWHLDFTK